jgi:hypothetical protein
MQQFFRNYSLEMALPASHATPIFHFGSERRGYELIALAWQDLDDGFESYTHISPQYFAHDTIELMTAWSIELKLVHKLRYGLCSGDWGDDKRKTPVITFAIRLECLNLDLAPIADLSGFKDLGFTLDVLRAEVIVANNNEDRDRAGRPLPIVVEEITRLGKVVVGKVAVLKGSYGEVLGDRNASQWRFEMSFSESWTHC